MNTDLKNKNIRVVQTGNWKYQGRVIDDNDNHITILDNHTGRNVTLRKDTLLVIEVLD